jgi:hypothetical protein
VDGIVGHFPGGMRRMQTAIRPNTQQPLAGGSGRDQLCVLETELPWGGKRRCRRHHCRVGPIGVRRWPVLRSP